MEQSSDDDTGKQRTGGKKYRIPSPGLDISDDESTFKPASSNEPMDEKEKSLNNCEGGPNEIGDASTTDLLKSINKIKVTEIFNFS